MQQATKTAKQEARAGARKIALLGAGKMGGILLEAFARYQGSPRLALSATVQHAERAATLARRFNLPIGTDNRKAARAADVIVVEAGDDSMAVAGGNVCAIARKRGVAGFIVDGVIRDIGESRTNGFPLFARGRSPIPAAKDGPGEINHPIRCGGVVVHPGDVVVADDEGIVVVPLAKAPEVLKKAQAKADADAQMSLEAWEKNHRAKVDATLKAKGYLG